MSEANATDALLRRISQLETELAETRTEAKTRRQALKAERDAHTATKAELTTVTTDRDGLKAKLESGPSGGLAAQVDELKGQLLARDHGAAFAKVPAFEFKGADGKPARLELNEGV